MIETIGQIIGITSVVGLVSLYLAFLGYLPELVIEGVADKSQAFNSESKLVIRNIGKLAAIGIQADIEDFNLYVMTNRFTGGTISGGPHVASRLSSGESTEISVTPGIRLGHGMHIDEFRYQLLLRYRAKLFFLKRDFSKKWLVALKNRPDGYHWEVKII